MTVAKAECHPQLQDALDFSEYICGIKEKKDEWTKHGELLSRISDRLYEAPGCQSHFAGFDNSLAFLSSDIIYEVLERIDEPKELKILADVNGTWGDVARNQMAFLEKFESKFGNTIINSYLFPFKERWEKFVRNASKLHGILELNGLCGFFDEKFAPVLKPHFYDLDLDFHTTSLVYSAERLKNLRNFFVKQLQSPCLRKFYLRIQIDLGLEEELLKFCLSDKFETLFWESVPLSVDFFVRIYEAYKNNQIAPDCRTRIVMGYFERSALKEIVQTLKLKRLNDRWRVKEFRREERLRVSDLLVTVGYAGSNRVLVTIELRHVDSYAEPSNVSEVERIRPSTEKPEYMDETEDEFADFDDYDRDDNNEGHVCDGKCELEAMDGRFWEKDDCDECAGCRLCEPLIRNVCERCSRVHNCEPHPER